MVDSRIVSAVEQVRWLTRHELQVWRLFAAVLVVLPDEVEAQLQRDGGLTQFGYAVLATLSEAPERSMRMTELAYMAHGSQSRLSHVMAGLERRGWVRRERSAEDRRGSVAVLTAAGYAKVEAIAPGHAATVRAAVFDALSTRQLDELEDICAALLPDGFRERLLRHQNGDTEQRPQKEDDMATTNPAAPEGDGMAAVARLLDAARGGSADGRDLAGGLSLLSQARRDLDFAELELIDRARAGGQTWEQVAAALDMPDRRQAQTRYRRLRERWPQYRPSAPA